MKLHYLLFSCLAIIIAASSCKKDNTPTALNPDVFKNNIAAVIHYDGDDTIPSGANFYHYDNQDRLQSYSIIAGDYRTTAISSYDSVVFIYNGADTLPVRADVYDVLVNSGEVAAQKYYYYDGQQRLIKDSVEGDLSSSFTQYSSETYVYSAGLITITASGGSTGATALTQVYLTADEKNIAKVVSNDPISATGSGTIIFSYNSGLVNPYYLNNAGRSLYYFGSGFLIFSSTQNAATQLSVIAPTGSGIATVNYSNIANSLPGRAVITADGDVLYSESYYYSQQ